MRPHVNDGLIAYINSHSQRGFRPIPHYFKDGGFISVYFSAESINDHLVIYRSCKDGGIVGCKITGVC